ncbi:hypothetical protein JCM4814A_58380 [Streptomyces phaeofaciens JCM 4814]|uniref:Mycothiol-dependent maleylpyruvate isomerase metal-binding domain-containing protein n=1 Tax=Streptomyces phaeofaciens TaxID=68254 RepID=A0A918HN08_9ACTN|nr:maleylpyruvate isomerase family mycothiol-dependent enzyme [Streptomyces phaeofaciens]GGT78879.1 hypothetical protein GCM10010226_66490 [Streptomyces phaeofaciens]
MTPEHDALRDLLAAWAFDAVTPTEAAAVSHHLGDCPECEAEAERLRDVVRLLDDPSAEPAEPEPSDDDPLTALFAGPRPGRRRPRPAAAPVAAHAAPYAGAVAALGALLPEVYGRWGYDRWSVPVVHDWDVHATLAHLIAADEQLALALGVAARVPASPASAAAEGAAGAGWEEAWNRRTADVILHERRRSPERTRASWEAQSAALLATPEARDPERAARAVELMGLRLPVTDHFAVRAFETWIHTDDIGRALGIAVPPPPAAHLERLVRLAVRILGTALGPAAAPVRFSVTGVGEWLLGSDADPVRAELALDPVDFCLLAGGRYAPGEVPCVGTGDAGTVREVLERTAALAWL